MARLLRCDGSVESVEPLNGVDFTLGELKHFVGGYIEVVYLGSGWLMVVNEEGKLLNLPINRTATQLYGNPSNDYIVGDVVLCRDCEVR